jgi:hypothetical protein
MSSRNAHQPGGGSDPPPFPRTLLSPAEHRRWIPARECTERSFGRGMSGDVSDKIAAHNA